MPNPALTRALEERPATAGTSRPLTLDDVVTSTGALLATTVAVGAAAALLLPTPTQMVVMMGAAVTALVLSLILSFTRLRFNPAAVFTFAAVEGLVLGPLTAAYSTMYDGVVTGAIGGTVCGFLGVLAAYKFGGVRVGSRGRRILAAAMLGFVALMIFDVVLLAFGASVGFAGFGMLGLVMSVVGLGLAAFSLIVDFEDVEDAIRMGAPQPVKWSLGFGLLVSIVWMYTNLLRLLGILSSD